MSDLEHLGHINSIENSIELVGEDEVFIGWNAGMTMEQTVASVLGGPGLGQGEVVETEIVTYGDEIAVSTVEDYPGGTHDLSEGMPIRFNVSLPESADALSLLGAHGETEVTGIFGLNRDLIKRVIGSAIAEADPDFVESRLPGVLVEHLGA